MIQHSSPHLSFVFNMSCTNDVGLRDDVAGLRVPCATQVDPKIGACCCHFLTYFVDPVGGIIKQMREAYKKQVYGPFRGSVNFGLNEGIP